MAVSIKRSGNITRRHVRAFNAEMAAEAIGKIEPGVEIHGFTDGQFSFIDMLEHLVNESGPADVWISTWTAAEAELRRLGDFFKSGRVRSVRMLADYNFERRQPAFCDLVRELFGDRSLRFSKVHCKIILIRSDTMSLVVQTSMNLNSNPRLENFSIINDGAFFDEYAEIALARFDPDQEQGGDLFGSLDSGR